MSKTKKRVLTDPLLGKNHYHKVKEFLPVPCRICQGTGVNVVNAEDCARCDGTGEEYVEETV